jgi:hypothetical protein
MEAQYLFSFLLNDMASKSMKSMASTTALVNASVKRDVDGVSKSFNKLERSQNSLVNSFTRTTGQFKGAVSTTGIKVPSYVVPGMFPPGGGDRGRGRGMTMFPPGGGDRGRGRGMTMFPPGGGKGTETYSDFVGATMGFWVLSAGIKNAAKEATEFERKLVYTEFISKSLVSDMRELPGIMRNIKDEAIKIGTTSYFSPQEVVSTAKQFIQGGIAPQIAMNKQWGDSIVDLAMRFSLLSEGQVNAAKSADFLIEFANKTGIVMDGTRQNVDSLSRSLDIMTQAQNLSLLELKDIPGMLNSSRMAFKNMQLDGEKGLATMLALTSQFRDAGWSAKEAGLNFKGLSDWMGKALNYPAFMAVTGKTKTMMVGEMTKYHMLGSILGLSGPLTTSIKNTGLNKPGAIYDLLIDPKTGRYRNIMDIFSDLEKKLKVTGIGEAGKFAISKAIFGDQIPAQAFMQFTKAKGIVGAVPPGLEKMYKPGQLLYGGDLARYRTEVMLSQRGISKELEKRLKDTLDFAIKVADNVRKVFLTILGMGMKSDIVNVLGGITKALGALARVLADAPKITEFLGRILLFITGIFAIAATKSLFSFMTQGLISGMAGQAIATAFGGGVHGKNRALLSQIPSTVVDAASPINVVPPRSTALLSILKSFGIFYAVLSAFNIGMNTIDSWSAKNEVELARLKNRLAGLDENANISADLLSKASASLLNYSDIAGFAIIAIAINFEKVIAGLRWLYGLIGAKSVASVLLGLSAIATIAVVAAAGYGGSEDTRLRDVNKKTRNYLQSHGYRATPETLLKVGTETDSGEEFWRMARAEPKSTYFTRPGGKAINYFDVRQGIIEGFLGERNVFFKMMDQFNKISETIKETAPGDHLKSILHELKGQGKVRARAQNFAPVPSLATYGGC